MYHKTTTTFMLSFIMNLRCCVWIHIQFGMCITIDIKITNLSCIVYHYSTSQVPVLPPEIVLSIESPIYYCIHLSFHQHQYHVVNQLLAIAYFTSAYFGVKLQYQLFFQMQQMTVDMLTICVPPVAFHHILYY